MLGVGNDRRSIQNHRKQTNGGQTIGQALGQH